MALNNSSSAVIRQINGGFVVVSAKYVPPNVASGAPQYFDEEEVFYADIESAVAAITAVFTA
jgi:hypothetical protein